MPSPACYRGLKDLMDEASLRRVVSFLPVVLVGAVLSALDVSAQVPVTPVPESIAQSRANLTRSITGAPGPAYWQIWPVYELEATLNPEDASVVGSGSISFENASPDTLREIYLRLDQNRFLPEVSQDAYTSGISLTQLVINGEDIPQRSPSVEGLRSTILRVALPTPLLPGAALHVGFSWIMEVPEASGFHLRQGRLGTGVYQIAQWYPRLARYDDLSGWDRAPHVPSLEFNNPFSTFDVALEVPAGWLIGATGYLQNPREVLSRRSYERLAMVSEADTTITIASPADSGTASSAETLTWRFRADSVSDFAWAASAEYSWTATSRQRTGRAPLVVHALLSSPGDHEALTRTVSDMIVSASSMLMPYAWDQHTLVGGPDPAMEYPMLTMSNGRASSHEVLHQWYPMMVGSDETRFVFLDEGFATALAGLATGRGIAAPVDAMALSEPMLLPDDVRRVRPLTEFGYWRGRDLLRDLANSFGDTALVRAMVDYSAAWRFKHPTPWDFMASVETSLGQPLDEFWIPWLFGTDAIVGGVR